MNTRPDVSAIQTDNIQVDALVANMLQEIGLENLEGVNHREEEEEQNWFNKSNLELTRLLTCLGFGPSSRPKGIIMC